MQQFLQLTFLDNSIEQWAKFLLLVGLAFLLKKYISVFFSSITYRPFRKFSSENEVKKFTALLSKPFELLILFCTIYYAFKSLHYPAALVLKNEDFDLKFILNNVLKTIGAIAITWIVLRIIDFLSFVFYQKYSSHDSVIDEQIVPFIKDSSKVLVSIMAIILILGVIFKLNVASIIAGIGIGGLAVALAAKESLENLFASFTIFLDKPFHVGDMIQVGSVTGTVERVGFRSTRIRTDHKTFVTMPNKQMVDSVLDNFTERTHRRVEMKLHLLQTTTTTQLEQVLQKIKVELEAHEMIEKDFTVLFNNITPASYELLVAYLVMQSDIKTFNEIKQQINFSIIQIIQAEHVQWAAVQEFLMNEVGKK